MMTMHAGGCLLTQQVFDAGEALDLLEREKATHVMGWAHYGKSMAEHPSFKQRDLSSKQRAAIESLQMSLDQGEITNEAFLSEIREIIGDTRPSFAFGGFRMFGSPFRGSPGDGHATTRSGRLKAALSWVTISTLSSIAIGVMS